MDGCVFHALFFSLLLPGLAYADVLNGEWVSTTRSLTMGNVGIASAEDPTTATFYNPAGLARAKKAVVEVFNPQFDFGTGVFSSSNSVVDWGKHLSSDQASALV